MTTISATQAHLAKAPKGSLSPCLIGEAERQQLLALTDLTSDPTHAMAQMVQEIRQALTGYPEQRRVTGERIVQAAHNYHVLGYPETAVVQAGTYTQWVSDTLVFLPHCFSCIPFTRKTVFLLCKARDEIHASSV